MLNKKVEFRVLRLYNVVNARCGCMKNATEFSNAKKLGKSSLKRRAFNTIARSADRPQELS